MPQTSRPGEQPPAVSGPVEEQRLRAGWTSLFSFTSKRHIAPLALALAFSIARGLAVPLLAWILGRLFNVFSSFGSHSISAGQLLSTTSLECTYILALGSGVWFLDWAYFSLWVIFGELQAKNARRWAFEELLHKEMRWFDGVTDGLPAVLPRIQAYIRDLQLSTSQPLGATLYNLTAAIAALVLALYMSWSLTLVCLASVPLCAIIIAFFSSKVQPKIEGQQVALTKASKIATTAISSVDVVKHFNSQDTEAEKYKTAIGIAAHWYYKEALYSASQIGLISFLTFGMFVQGFWYGSYLVAKGSLNAGQVLTTFWACLQATQSIEEIIPRLIILEKGRTASAAIKQIFNDACHACTLRELRGTTLSPLFCEGDIRFSEVTFAYPSQPGRRVLDNCSFFFPAGDTTFVVGKSGSGKSTIGNLLMRFYAPTFGEIHIDGRLIQTLDISWIRNNITLVQQESILFNETMLKNITFGSRNAEETTARDIFAATKLAGLQDTILSFPLGLDTVVGSGGRSLSGGQRQRMALARARLRDTPILILDESTSALDYSSRITLMNAIRAWRQGKTTIIITHDLSQIRSQDFVYVIDQGKIAHQGYRHILEKKAAGVFDLNNLATLPTDTTPTTSHWSAKSPGAMSDKGKRSSFSSIERPMTERRSLTTPISPFFHNSLSLERTFSEAEQSSQSRRSSMVERLIDHASPRFRKAPLDALDDKRVEKDLEQPPPATGDNQAPLPLKLNNEPLQRGYSMSQILLTVIPSLSPSNRMSLLFGFIAAFFHAAATPCFSYVFSQLLTTFFIVENRSRLAMQWALAVLGVAVVNGIASFFMHYLLERCGQAWVDQFRYKAIRRILHQCKSWFEKDENSLSNLTHCLDRNPEEMRNLVGRFACFIFVAAVMTLIGFIWGVAVCWKLALVGAATAPPLYGLTRLYEKISGFWENKSNEASEIMAGVFTETFLDIRTVRSLTLESYFHTKHNKSNGKALTVGIKRGCYSGLLFGFSECSILFVHALIFYYGAILVSSSQYSAKDVLMVFSMLLFSMANVRGVLSLVPQISSSRDSATRVLHLVNMPEDQSHEGQGNLRIHDLTPLNFKDVDFSYPNRPGKKVLNNFNLKIPKGSCTAIVGPSGSGKSTIASLLLALYPSPPSAGNTGTITLGGVNIRNIHVPTLRSLISIVPQDPTLFPASIKENIIYGLPGNSSLNTSANIQAAATAAGIHDFISSLPSGYDTLVGDGGVGVSGGQAQRIVIARALVRRPRLLILDEATSSLDVESATVIKQTVTRLMASGRSLTVIIITHAKDMMELADNVVVVDGGAVVEEGTFSDLSSRSGGRLRRLLRMQL
ncbi:ABC a-pheromone efflux pump AtrD [Trichophyton interdigitale]|uniref:ABC a-pheromone efflux pump AtrD n=1 Tax=Trichophyton interdigitale TaxID=101480 RepID=A0A9P4YFM2_9EURO|nr:ABC a-pheromone efflux pump AtrD [Trichophyton interdigitale]KAF3893139.1 ABC a-pheromone efflux pump AtrD [Trichophyton interdigitale]KAG8207946.1 ABC a-pheromone efflux pump AtrD [Trichophyton interdigitale]